MAETMRALVWDGNPYPEGLSMRDFPIPEVKPGWVLVEVKALGICGTDLHYFQGFGRYLFANLGIDSDEAAPEPEGPSAQAEPEPAVAEPETEPDQSTLDL